MRVFMFLRFLNPNSYVFRVGKEGEGFLAAFAAEQTAVAVEGFCTRSPVRCGLYVSNAWREGLAGGMTVMSRMKGERHQSHAVDTKNRS